jgi:tetratricopeptide (TPR) repeat protein
MLVHHWNHETATGVVAGEAALALARAADLPEQIAYILNDLYSCYLEAHRPAEAAAAITEAVQRWRALGNLPMLADALINIAEFQVTERNYAGAIALVDEALAISQRIDNVWGQAYAYFARSMVQFQLGRLGQARHEFAQCIDLAGRAGFVFAQVIGRGMLGWVYWQLGAPDRAEQLLATAVQVADQKVPVLRTMPLGMLLEVLIETAQWDRAAVLAARPDVVEMLAGPTDGSAGFVFTLHLALGELALQQGRRGDALAHAESAIAILRQMLMVPALPDALEFMSRARLAGGDLAGARAALDEARAVTEPVGARRMLWAIYRTLAAVATAEGHAAEAARHLAAARAELAYLADQIDDPVLLQSFLARPAVRAVWEGLGDSSESP